MDNCVSSVNTEEELRNFINKLTEIMVKGKFDLRCWEHTKIYNDEDKDKAEVTKVLVLLWDKREDSLFCDVPKMKMNDMTISRRTVLSITQRIVDPIGLNCPVTLIPKLILQRILQEKVSWDTELTEGLKKEFLVWLEDLPLLSSVRIPRQAATVNKIACSLHVFADASRNWYATVIFLRSESHDEIKVQLLQAKSRVSPLRKITILRLKLLACYFGAKLSEFVTKSLTLEINETYYWTDSTTALFWIKKKDLPWGTFVCNRVKKIRECSDPKNWRHVPGIIYPAI
ncbi:uncharacterized protein [Parasteatoda tepidariorum]|uniref:uncharacterized protein n=1 Tax=Parasteatoda tepidariorum TaxID=114398 RepID=UPI0039BD8ED4